MQIKGYILMRRGFTMIMAIFFLILVATLAMFALSLSATTSKHTTDIFLREQAELAAQGATEMAIQNFLTDPTPLGAGNCPGNNYFTTRLAPNGAATQMFDITVDVVQFFGNIPGCATATPINTPASEGTVIMDVTVTSNPAVISTPIRFHRRTIQKL